MAKLAQYDAGNTLNMLIFHCPGCNEGHVVSTRVHQWNGSMEKPTFSPSILWSYQASDRKHVCHCYVNDGRIQFLNDCTHPLAGQTVDMPEWPADQKTHGTAEAPPLEVVPIPTKEEVKEEVMPKEFSKGDVVLISNSTLDKVPARVVYQLGSEYVCRLTAVHEGFLVAVSADQLTAAQ